MFDSKHILRAAGAATVVGLLAGHASAQTCGSVTGPDVIVGNVGGSDADTGTDGVQDYTAVGAIDAFAVGTYSCNIGDTWLNWISGSNQHPVIPQNMYRLKNGRFEQLGLSWMKHGFFALSENFCCNNCQGTDGTHLGVGCSDPYTPGRNGTQVTTTGGLGPRFQVNPHTGAFIFPYAFRAVATPGGTTNISRRLQVALTDLDPGLNAGARFFFESQYVTPDDAAYGNQDNNASYREAAVTGATGASNYNASMTGFTTVRMKPAITAWKTIDPTVVETIINTSEIPGAAPAHDSTGRAYLSAKVTDLGGGVWHYEYAIFNLNSDRAFDGVSFPVSASQNVTNLGFHDVAYHDGDGYNSTVATPVTFDGTDWAASEVGATVQWNMVPVAPLENSNALRWATLYNIRFDCNSPPTNGSATLSYFKDPVGLPTTINVATLVPTPAAACPSDIAGGNGIVDVGDLLAVITNWGACPGACPPSCSADIQQNCVVDVGDLLAVITAWGACP